MKEIEVMLEAMDLAYKRRYDHNPIHSIQSRIKSLGSMFEKLRRKNFEETFESALENLKDIAGLRVICYYIKDVYSIIEELKNQNNLIIIKEKDYIKNPKPNGYRSYHLIIGVEVYENEEKQYYPVEIQICTLSIDFWASIEQQLCYKASGEKKEEIFYNDGKEIEEEKMNKIWESFYKTDEARTRNEGNNIGLGLYIVKTIILAHKGEVGVRNIDNGVEFCFTLDCYNP